MAIQIWSDGQYKSVDLAQYGADGTLSGAYVWRDGAWRTLWEKASSLPVVEITATLDGVAQNQFRQACIDYGTTYDTVAVLPFQLDTSQATNLSVMFRDCAALTRVPDLDTSQVTSMASMFRNCAALTQVPDLDTAQVTSMPSMFRNCAALTDGNVRLIGKHPSVTTGSMIVGSGLSREPFYDTAGNPI